MSESLKADVSKAVASNSKPQNEAPVKLKHPQYLQHSLDGAFKSPQVLNEHVEKTRGNKDD